METKRKTKREKNEETNWYKKTKRSQSDDKNEYKSVFRINVREVHTNAMERQLTEAIKIEHIERPSLNRKSRYDMTRLHGRRNNCRIQ